MQLVVRSLSGDTVSLDAVQDCTIADIKHHLATHHPPWSGCRLFYAVRTNHCRSLPTTPPWHQGTALSSKTKLATINLGPDDFLVRLA